MGSWIPDATVTCPAAHIQPVCNLTDVRITSTTQVNEECDIYFADQSSPRASVKPHWPRILASTSLRQTNTAKYSTQVEDTFVKVIPYWIDAYNKGMPLPSPICNLRTFRLP